MPPRAGPALLNLPPSQATCASRALRAGLSLHRLRLRAGNREGFFTAGVRSAPGHGAVLGCSRTWYAACWPCPGKGWGRKAHDARLQDRFWRLNLGLSMRAMALDLGPGGRGMPGAPMYKDKFWVQGKCMGLVKAVQGVSMRVWWRDLAGYAGRSLLM